MGLTRELNAGMVKAISFSENNTKITLRPVSFKNCDLGLKITSNGSTKLVRQHSLNCNQGVSLKPDLNVTTYDAELELSPLASPGPRSELDAAALKLQKVYKSYRTRRNLADCAVVVEELWWKALDYAFLNHSSISFFNGGKPESAVSRWARARTRVAKVGKGLSKNVKAQKLALQHWLEAIDPRHRYGHNLHFYYDVWFKSESSQPFFYWLDIGDGKEMNIEECPRVVLQHQCVEYLGPNEREDYEVIVESGCLVYKRSGKLVNTIEGSKWIFVLSTTRGMYVGKKKKGRFQHSSFLAGGAITAAGRLIVRQGILKAVWPYSGHYRPTEENFKEFISFLRENNVDLTDVKTCPIDEESSLNNYSDEAVEVMKTIDGVEGTTRSEEEGSPRASATSVFSKDDNMDVSISVGSMELVAYKWTTRAGARIGCVRDYPTDLQFKALEQVNLSPMSDSPTAGNKGPIPSPRPGSGLRLSAVLANMNFCGPTVSLTLPKIRKR